ncbi:MAG: hypothetical protein F4X63_06085 [Nitrospira sp. SB0662_bin_26]|nr:hypothetical protein [Nitrospira sp. SB0662_bin_26]
MPVAGRSRPRTCRREWRRPRPRRSRPRPCRTNPPATSGSLCHAREIPGPHRNPQRRRSCYWSRPRAQSRTTRLSG